MFLKRAILTVFLIALIGTWPVTSTAHDESAEPDDQLRYYLITAKFP